MDVLYQLSYPGGTALLEPNAGERACGQVSNTLRKIVHGVDVRGKRVSSLGSAHHALHLHGGDCRGHMPGETVAKGSGEGIARLRDAAHRARLTDDALGMALATAFVAAQRLRERRAPQLLAQRDDVLQGLGRPLPEVGGHRVGGIADQDHVPAMPARQPPQVLDRKVGAIGDRRGSKNIGDRIVPGGELVLEILAPLSIGEDSEPVGPLPRQGNETEAPAATHRLRSTAGCSPAGRGDPAPGGVASGARDDAGGDDLADDRANAVGAEDEVGLERLALCLQRTVDGVHLGAELDVDGERGAEAAQELRPMDAEQRAEAAGNAIQWRSGDDLASRCKCGPPGDDVCAVVEDGAETEGLEGMNRIWPKRETSAAALHAGNLAVAGLVKHPVLRAVA